MTKKNKSQIMTDSNRILSTFNTWTRSKALSFAWELYKNRIEVPGFMDISCQQTIISKYSYGNVIKHGIDRLGDVYSFDSKGIVFDMMNVRF